MKLVIDLDQEYAYDDESIAARIRNAIELQIRAEVTKMVREHKDSIRAQVRRLAGAAIKELSKVSEADVLKAVRKELCHDQS